MDSCKSKIHKRLESIYKSPSSISPLRRKSIVQTPTSTISENDDEAERVSRRRIIFTSSPTNNKRRSLNLGLLSNIPAPQMAESINQCIKLNAENKINIKNAFSLEMIDFMTYMIKKEDANMSNLQVASTSLDVSTKIYGYRVDNLHMEILKIIGGMDKQTMDDTKEQQNAVQEDAEANIEVQKKKKKKTSQKIISTIEVLRGNVEIARPILTTLGESDLQTSDMLYQVILPNHANTGFYLHPYNDVLVDVLKNTSQIQSDADVKYTIPTIEDFSNLEICPSYLNFEFLDWSVENEPQEEEENEEEKEEEIEFNSENNKFQFDLDASIEHDNDPAPEPMNYFDINHDDENNIEVCFQKTVADRPNIATVPRIQTSEYFFVEPKVILHWAGPSHWKFGNFTRNTESNTVKQMAATQTKSRKQKQYLLYNDELYNVINAKFVLSESVKLLANTIKSEWNTENLILPNDMHYTLAHLSNLWLHQKMYTYQVKKEKNRDVADISDIDNYDYNNQNDTLEYCPNVEHNDDYNDSGNRNNGDNDNNNEDCNSDNPVLSSQGFIGDNLVTAPKLVNKIIIPYCLKAKKIDMRQLKTSIWRCLTSTDDNAAKKKPNEIETEIETATEIETEIEMKKSKKFSDVYKNLPKLLTRNNAEALSVPLSFISMLHLANEKELVIRSIPDLSDLIIESK